MNGGSEDTEQSLNVKAASGNKLEAMGRVTAQKYDDDQQDIEKMLS